MAPVSAVVLHGLPEPDIGVFHRFDKIELELRQKTPLISCFDWSACIPVPLLALARGTFGTALARHFQSHLYQDSDINPSSALLVLAYSAGGFIFYKWLLDPKVSQKDKDRIILVVMLAAPYQCLDGYVRLEYNKRKLSVGEAPLTRQEISQIAQQLAGKLKVLLGENDGTIKETDCFFPSEVASHYDIEQTLIPQATHLSICREQGVIDYLKAYLSGLPDP